ncbi:MAG: sugar phosphate isomerase/epimerase [Chromatiales bacterium]|nr:sugar phosphate isomerase/epimerase [Chromatiales bacterium]
MHDRNLLSINQLTTRDQWSLPEAADGYARAGVGAMAVWWEKLREVGAARAARVIRDAGLAVTGYCAGGLLTARDPASRQQRIDDNRRMVDEAVAIGSSCLVALGGGLDPDDRDIDGARRRALDGFAELLPYVRDAGIVLALEPLHPMVCATRSVLCTLRQANDWCDALGGGPDVDSGIGIALDTYNVWWDPELESQIERAAGRIAAYHVSDWLPDTRDLRFDRGMPGDGVIDFRRFAERVTAAGYRGRHEVEILSSRWWREDPETVVATVLERFRSVM